MKSNSTEKFKYLMKEVGHVFFVGMVEEMKLCVEFWVV